MRMSIMCGVMLRIPPEEAQDILHTQLRHRFALNSSFGQSPFLPLQVEDSLLDTVGDSDLVDYHVNCLIEPMDSIDGLFFNKLRGLISNLLLY